jgi:hypothetical protein
LGPPAVQHNKLQSTIRETEKNKKLERGRKRREKLKAKDELNGVEAKKKITTEENKINEQV